MSLVDAIFRLWSAQQQIEDIAKTPDNRKALKILLEQAVPRAKILISQITQMINLEKQQPANNKHKKILTNMADVRGSICASLASIRAYILTGNAEFKSEFESHRRQHNVSVDELTEFNRKSSVGRHAECVFYHD